MKKALTWIILALCALSLLISVGLFFNMGVFVDEANCSPADVCGGFGWLLADWVRLALLAAACLLGVIGLCIRRKDNRNGTGT